MEDQSVWDSIVEAFESLIDQVIDATPRVIAAFVIMVVGLLVASLIGRLVRRLLRVVEKQKHIRKALASMGSAGNLARLTGKFVYWIVLAIFLSAAVEVLELAVLTDTVNAIIGYAPQLFGAAIIAGVAFVGSQILRDLTQSALSEFSAPASRGIAIGVQIFILVFGVTTAVAQLGLDVQLLTDNLTVVVAGFALAFGLAFGLGGKNHASSFLSYMVSGRQFEVGQKVKVGEVSGAIKSLSVFSLVVETREGDIIASYDQIVL